MKRTLIASSLAALLSTSLFSANVTDEQKNSGWYTDAQTKLQEKLAYVKKTHKAKNVILFVGDGMGISTVTASRILEGQNRGETGEENYLSFGKFPHSGLVKTYNTDSQTPDSAGTMTAMVTGVKTKIGVLSVSDATLRGDCASSKGTEVTTIMELAEDMNKSTGVISTARITHATPAATYAHSADRNWEYSAPQGCVDIASQFLNFNHGDGIDVAMGGGRRNFMPKESTDVEGKNGKRKDGRDLRDEWKTKYPNGSYVETQAQFDNVDVNATSKLFGLFNYSHMQYEQDRANDVAGEPSLTQMTEKAIKILSKNSNGFVLMIEAGRIDHAHHAGNAAGALNDTIEMAKAVAKADALTDDNDTLILVTADHSHVFTIAGYPVRGNPILGKVRSSDGHGGNKGLALASDNKPYTTLGYTNGRGFMDLGNETNSDAAYGNPIHMTGRLDVNLTDIDTTALGFHQEAVVPKSSETHAGEDIAVYAKGPGSHLAEGVMEQNVIFHIMNKAADLGGKPVK
jgi:alkaline phosphatase